MGQRRLVRPGHELVVHAVDVGARTGLRRDDPEQEGDQGREKDKTGGGHVHNLACGSPQVNLLARRVGQSG